MFTGIVEHMGTVERVDVDLPVHRLWVDCGPMISSLEEGDSILVDGVCLTAVENEGDVIGVDVVGETLKRTNLGSLNEGDPVNLERAMAADGRFDGHLVQGHVDGVGSLLEVAREDDGRRLTISIPEGLEPFIVEKGSITVDGVSLTVAGVAADRFDVAIIPHTLEVTTLGLRKVGHTVNLEVDVIAKYVERLLSIRP